MYKNGKPHYNEIVFTEEEEQKIIKLYQSGLSSVKIGKIFNQRYSSILKVLRKHNIPINGNKMKRKYDLDEEYFDIIDTPNKAYVLGFLFADGHNGISKGTVTMSLQIGDKYILESIRKELKSAKPLEYLDYSQKNDYGYHYQDQYRLNVFSIHMCKTLEKMGMISNKSTCLDFPDIPKGLYRHFIRGYFDGNGTINKKQGSFGLVSTKSFVTSVKDILEGTLDLHYGIIKESPCLNGITYDLFFHRRAETKKIYDWLYTDAELYLTRKYDRYQKLFYAVA